MEPFKSKMEEFMEGADKSMAKLHQSLEECRELFLETMRFYHFSPKALGQPEDPAADPQEASAQLLHLGRGSCSGQ